MEGPPWGGSEELWSQAAVHLVKAGHSVLAAMRQPRREPLRTEHPKFKALKAAGVQLHLIHKRQKLVRQILRDPPIQWLLDFKPDLTIISMGWLFNGAEWMQALRAAGIPYAILVQAVNETYRPKDWQAFANSYQHAQCAYFVAEDNLRAATRLLMARPQAALVVRNPFQVPYKQPLPWPNEDGTTRLAMVARIDFPVKGHDLLLETLALPKWRVRKIEVSFFGTGPDLAYFQQMATFWNLSQVQFRGQVSDIADIWRTHHALVLPSRVEGTPLAMVEAMLCGRPVIVTNVAGNAEIAEDGLSGFVAAAPKTEYLDETMERAWARRSEWPAMGIRAAERARQLFPEDPGAVFADLLAGLMPRWPLKQKDDGPE